MTPCKSQLTTCRPAWLPANHAFGWVAELSWALTTVSQQFYDKNSLETLSLICTEERQQLRWASQPANHPVSTHHWQWQKLPTIATCELQYQQLQFTKKWSKNAQSQEQPAIHPNNQPIEPYLVMEEEFFFKPNGLQPLFFFILSLFMLTLIVQPVIAGMPASTWRYIMWGFHKKNMTMQAPQMQLESQSRWRWCSKYWRVRQIFF